MPDNRGLNGSIDSHSPSKKSSNNKVWRKAPPISITIPTRSKPSPSAKKALAFRSAKSLDEERSVMELRVDRRPELPSMYRNMSSDTSGSSANQKAEVIVINNEGVQSSFLIDENGHVLEEEDVSSGNDSIYKLDTKQIEHESEVNSSDEDAANIKELNMEFNEAVNSKQANEQINLENVLRSIQSHAVRVKMLNIRRDNLKRSSKQL